MTRKATNKLQDLEGDRNSHSLFLIYSIFHLIGTCTACTCTRVYLLIYIEKLFLTHRTYDGIGISVEVTICFSDELSGRPDFHREWMEHPADMECWGGWCDVSEKKVVNVFGAAYFSAGWHVNGNNKTHVNIQEFLFEKHLIRGRRKSVL